MRPFSLAVSGASDTRFVLFSDVVSAYAVGLPLALLLGFTLGFGVWGVFLARALEEVVKVALFLGRYRTARWYPEVRTADAAVASA